MDRKACGTSQQRFCVKCRKISQRLCVYVYALTAIVQENRRQSMAEVSNFMVCARSVMRGLFGGNPLLAANPLPLPRLVVLRGKTCQCVGCSVQAHGQSIDIGDASEPCAAFGGYSAGPMASLRSGRVAICRLPKMFLLQRARLTPPAGRDHGGGSGQQHDCRRLRSRKWGRQDFRSRARFALPPHF